MRIWSLDPKPIMCARDEVMLRKCPETSSLVEDVENPRQGCVSPVCTSKGNQRMTVDKTSMNRI